MSLQILKVVKGRENEKALELERGKGAGGQSKKRTEKKKD